MILAADDDPSIRRVIEIALGLIPCVVKTASDGNEAIQMLRRMVPKVLILDINMPGPSGLDICHIVKRDDRLKDVPVILLTARDAPADYTNGHAAGAVIYMAKPFKPERLAQVVQMLLSQPPRSEDPHGRSLSN